MLPLEIFRDSQGLFAASTFRGERVLKDDSYSGFSLCTYTGDSMEHTDACRRNLADYLGISPDRIIVPRQTHSANIAIVRGEDNNLEGIDALVCDMPGYAIGINTADCVPVLLADTNAGIIGAAHAGWRGAVAGIVSGTVAKMESLGAKAASTEVFIGACIHTECFEVGEEVAEHFPESCVVRDIGTRPHVDLVEAVVLDLLSAGVLRENIHISAGCTQCNPRRYFSARSIGINSGRNFSFIMLRE